MLRARLRRLNFPSFPFPAFCALSSRSFAVGAEFLSMSFEEEKRTLARLGLTAFEISFIERSRARGVL